MPKLEQFLGSKLSGARRIAILAIGSEFRGDDAAGLVIVEHLVKIIKKPHKRIKIFIGATAPENLTGDIKKFKPSHIILLDSVDFNEKPGSVIVLNPSEIGDGVSFSTHKMPAKVLIRYFSNELKCETMLIGIQPKSIDFGARASKSVISSAKEVAAAIAGALS